MSDSIHILTGDEEIANFLKVSVPHIRRHGDDIPVIRRVGNIRITSEEALQAFLISGIGTATSDEEEENKRDMLWYESASILDISPTRTGAWLAERPCTAKGVKGCIWPVQAMHELLNSNKKGK